jgi:3-oxoacyl-[acyl-carrier-protein] synthase-3
MAAQAIRSGSIKSALVIGSETLSRVVNWTDRGTCILFGDGAGAFVLQGSETPGGVLTTLLRSDGSGAYSLAIPAGGSRMPASVETVRDNLHTIRMDGKEVYRFATRVMASAAREVIEGAGLKPEDIALVIPHQANRRIIESAARGLNMPEEKFFVNLDRYGNTSTASIPIAMCEAVAQGRVRSNDNLVLVGFGGGLTWGAAVVKWDVPIHREIPRWHSVQRDALYSLARVRSLFRRGLRRLEGIVYGAQAEPDEPAQKKK